MKKLTLIIATVIGIQTFAMCQCTSLFSYTASSDTVSFTNHSSLAYAHYFWNFGDGIGSNQVSPVHAFPGTGDYMVTLFAKDTVSNCATYSEQWVSVIKPFAGSCYPGISDSIYTSGGRDWLMVYDTSANCTKYAVSCGGGGCYGLPVPISTTAFRMVCYGVYFDTTNWQNTAEAFKSAYHNYSSSHNYGDSSANFEFIVVAKDASHERILCTAMNKNAVSYKWFIGGGSDTVFSTSDTVSQSFPFYLNASCPLTAGLVIQASSGYRDTIYQNIMPGDSLAAVLSVNNLKYTAVKVSVYPNPGNGIFNITLSGNSTNHPEQNGIQVEIYNVLGERVYSPSTIGNLSFTINLSNQPNGVYFYRLIGEDGSLIGEGKLVVAH